MVVGTRGLQQVATDAAVVGAAWARDVVASAVLLELAPASRTPQPFLPQLAQEALCEPVAVGIRRLPFLVLCAAA